MHSLLASDQNNFDYQLANKHENEHWRIWYPPSSDNYGMFDMQISFGITDPLRFVR